MTDAELFLESIQGFLEGRAPAEEFALDFNDLFDTRAGVDPVQLWAAFEELAVIAFRFLNECEAKDWPDDMDDAHVRAAAQSAHDTAMDIIRRRGLHNIR